MGINGIVFAVRRPSTGPDLCQSLTVVPDNIRKLKPFADDPDSVDLTLALGDEHLFKIGADWHEDFHDDSNSDSQDEADSASQPVFIEGSRRQEITGPLRGGETRYFVDTTIAGVADAHTPDEVPETALFPGNHFGTYASVGCQKQSVCAHVAHNVSGPGWGDRSQQTRDIVYVCSQDILSSDEPFLRSPACYDPEYDPHGPDVDLERDPEWQRSALGGPPAILIHELFHTFALMGGDGGEPWLDQVVRLNGQDRKLYEELCFDVPKTPRNVRRCLKNPDSYAQFITEMFLLEQGWRWDKGSGRWIRYSDNYEEPANTKAKDV